MDGFISPRDFGFLYRIVRDGSQRNNFLGDTESIKRLENLGLIQQIEDSLLHKPTFEGVFYVNICLRKIHLYSSREQLSN